MAGAAEDRGQGAAQQGADGGQAGADDADVDFDRAPVADGDVVPRGILGVGELHQRVQSEDTDEGDAV